MPSVPGLNMSIMRDPRNPLNQGPGADPPAALRGEPGVRRRPGERSRDGDGVTALTHLELLVGAPAPFALVLAPITLLVAAVAEVEQLSVLHYDADFELVASITGQPTEWVVPRDSID